MRIISQDKKFDLPYGETTLQALGDGRVIAFPLSDLSSDAFMIMAKYSTEEKAMKAMEMCREKYQGIFTKGNCMLDHPKVFRFPADDEI